MPGTDAADARVASRSALPARSAGAFSSLSLADEAIELFCDRARRTKPEFRVTADNREIVTEICRRLDGLPLAIELAAARVRALSPTEILDSLHDQFRLLTGGARTAVRRQQTLRASVDWSHALLSEPEQVLFRRLAVFSGGFDVDAAHAVAGGAEVERYQVLDQLTLLVDKSLVVADDSKHATRYRLLETVRQYAQEKLHESREGDDVRSRHRDHYTAMAALLDAPADGGYHARIEWADAEIDNLRAAFAWSRERADTELALTLASSLQPLWLSRGRMQEGLNWLGAALADAAHGATRNRQRRGWASVGRTVLLSFSGVPDGPRPEDPERTLAAARELGDPALVVRALTACGAFADARPRAGERVLRRGGRHCAGDRRFPVVGAVRRSSWKRRSRPVRRTRRGGSGRRGRTSDSGRDRRRLRLPSVPLRAGLVAGPARRSDRGAAPAS